MWPRTDSAIELSIVLPAFNEEKTIGFCLAKANLALQKILPSGARGEIVVADNGSSDNTAAVAARLGARVEKVESKGYGSALIGGIKASKGKYVIIADADDSYNLEEIAPFYEKLKSGHEFVMGNRFKGRIEQGAMPPLHRYLGTPVLTGIMNIFFRTGIGDTNCGMRGMTRDAFNRMRLRATGMEFATEMVVKASLLKLKIAEVPCNLYKDKRDRKSNLRTWHDGWRHLRFMLLFTPTWTFLVPGLAALGSGAVGMAFIWWRDLFNPDFAPFLSHKHILSSMLLFMLGAQIIAFGLIAKTFTFSKNFDSVSRAIRVMQRYFSLEKGLLAGLALTVAGAAIFAYLPLSFYGRWTPVLDDAIRIDIAVVAITCFVSGIQLIFLSFVLSLMYLKVR